MALGYDAAKDQTNDEGRKTVTALGLLSGESLKLKLLLCQLEGPYPLKGFSACRRNMIRARAPEHRGRQRKTRC